MFFLPSDASRWDAKTTLNYELKIKSMKNIVKSAFLFFFLLPAQICPAQEDGCYTIGFNAGKAAYAQGEAHLSGSRYGQALASFEEAKDYFASTKENCWKPNVSALNEWIRKCDEAIQRVGGIEMVYVQGGTFRMGCTGEQGTDCWDYEKPAHQVTLSGFSIGKYEVTQAQWKAVMGSNPSNFKGDNLPVERVSWNDVQEFIRKLNAQTGQRYRLPTEAEWEYAARGGNQGRGYKYSGSNTPKNVACYDSGKTHPVGTKTANELGIYDMSGNVWEWCYDRESTYPASAQNNPTGASSGSYRVRRGGGWSSYASNCRVAIRSFDSSGESFPYLGFRLACSL
jgi:formylglycine-generating enzyme required for sulfatase activity